MEKFVINSRSDLDAIAGTSQHAEFMRFLKGSMTRKQNIQVYPDGYGTPEYEGPILDPIWGDVEDLSTITAFGFTPADFEGI